MPKLIIDDIAVEVAPGTSVLEAARSVGIVIPHFCYHPALAIAAACRLCAVKLLDGPVKGIQMSCALAAQDGMVVSTTDPEALKMRSLVIEWLMLNHPHDCPVCDEGGECLLQDYTIAGGHALRRYQGKKRTFQNQYLGEYIQHEMNRCIECYRCSRFYQEYAGGTDFGPTGIAGRVYFGRDRDGALESPFSGNILDICPTGVFTDKTARFRARYWDFEMASSVCPHCSMGCNLTPQCYHRELLKIAARRNDQVNGWFICDRGRFDKADVNDPERPRFPMVDGAQTSVTEALDACAARLSDFVRKDGSSRLALVGSPRLSLEGGIMLARLAAAFPGASLCYFADKTQAARSRAALEALTPHTCASPVDVAGADCIAICCSDLMEQAPMLSLSVRRASLKGAQVFLVGEGRSPDSVARLPFRCTVVPALEQVPLAAAKQGVVICFAPEVDPALLKRLAAGSARLALLQPGPNAFGAALLSTHHEALSLEEALANGVQGVVAVECDLPPDVAGHVSVIAAADWRASAATGEAGIFLPTTAWPESDGTYINYAGRAQRFRHAMRPGLPLRKLDPLYYKAESTLPVPPIALHPPRVFREEPPGGDAAEAWRVLWAVLEKVSGTAPAEPLSGKWSFLAGLTSEGEGQTVWEAMQ